jgi:hypothetical protein
MLGLKSAAAGAGEWKSSGKKRGTVSYHPKFHSLALAATSRSEPDSFRIQNPRLSLLSWLRGFLL